MPRPEIKVFQSFLFLKTILIPDYLLSDGSREDEEIPAVGPVCVLLELVSVEEEVGEEEDSWEGDKEDGAG